MVLRRYCCEDAHIPAEELKHSRAYQMPHHSISIGLYRQRRENYNSRSTAAVIFDLIYRHGLIGIRLPKLGGPKTEVTVSPGRVFTILASISVFYLLLFCFSLFSCWFRVVD